MSDITKTFDIGCYFSTGTEVVVKSAIAVITDNSKIIIKSVEGVSRHHNSVITLYRYCKSIVIIASDWSRYFSSGAKRVIHNTIGFIAHDANIIIIAIVTVSCYYYFTVILNGN